ncbi:Arylsulfatase [hydrothermal vent metagenome]|uniref:Arylsulfatase n=1 Tax=hydrothermal vent metagenome TaxID=652676 RepID=A0A3B1DZL0_9ZZZZ
MSRSLTFPILFFGLFFTLFTQAPLLTAAEKKKVERPNIVVIFTDDQGYQDLGVYGSPDIKTPHIDQMAKEGIRFTDFYVSQAICSASRAALLTGCYSNRVGILGALGPRDTHGINDKEMTIAEVLKQQGYATAMYGKWHLGHHPQYLPTNHGFDDYFGLPYSHDMWPLHPAYLNLPKGDPKRKRAFPDLPLLEGTKETGTKVIKKSITPKDQSQLTTWYTEHTVQFIEKHQKEPFFIYVAHSMPHVPLYVSDKFKGKSKRGLYGDVIMEIDWSVGQILKTLKRLNLDEKTLVIFTSDNGPWLSYGDHAGSALPLREGKQTMWDGGCREPFIARWPGKIPAGKVCHEMAATIDILPTVAKLANAPLPKQKIDGKDIWNLLSGKKNAKTPHEVYYFYYGKQLQAVRSGKWKLHFPHHYNSLKGKPGQGGKPGPYKRLKTDFALYNLENDISEKTNLLAKHPSIVKKLKAYGEQAREDLGDNNRKGKGQRPAGQLRK